MGVANMYWCAGVLSSGMMGEGMLVRGCLVRSHGCGVKVCVGCDASMRGGDAMAMASRADGDGEAPHGDIDACIGDIDACIGDGDAARGDIGACIGGATIGAGSIGAACIGGACIGAACIGGACIGGLGDAFEAGGPTDGPMRSAAATSRGLGRGPFSPEARIGRHSSVPIVCRPTCRWLGSTARFNGRSFFWSREGFPGILLGAYTNMS